MVIIVIEATLSTNDRGYVVVVVIKSSNRLLG